MRSFHLFSSVEYFKKTLAPLSGCKWCVHTHACSHIQLACTCFCVLGMHVILLNPCYYLSLKNKKMVSEVKELSQAPVEGLIWTLIFSCCLRTFSTPFSPCMSYDDDSGMVPSKKDFPLGFNLCLQSFGTQTQM